jgi:ectoine hydroxylase-related dioxygenase (phytanoyl-CoA dioxygenase family)
MLTQTQIAHYNENGFLLLKGFVADSEIEMLRDELDSMIAHAPVRRGAAEDKFGQPIEHPNNFAFIDLNTDGTQQVLNRISSPLARSERILQAYGNPTLLKAVESLYGQDFVPFAESVVIKMPGNGARFAWHQDGNFKTGVHPERGVNFGIYLHDSNEENGCLHLIPESHRWGRVDLKAMIEANGERLPGAIPVPAAPGDVVVHDRNLVHGSFVNPSTTLRITVYFGFHTRKTVEGVFEAEHIEKRARAIPLAVRLRAESGLFPGEAPYLPLHITEYFTPFDQKELLRTPPLAL